MPVLIGGSPSTGSSLLRQMLNRHSTLYCGPEAQLFAHPHLFDKWNEVKSRLLRKPLLISPDLQLMKGAPLAGDEQGWTQSELVSAINQCKEFKVFCETYFGHSARRYGKQVWIDKTPANVLSFDRFLNTWEESNVIHIVRDPLDIVASLMQRGLSLFLAVSRYLFNTAHALKCMNHERYHVLHYEALVTEPDTALGLLLDKIGLVFEPAMLNKGNPQMSELHRMPGWRSSEIELPNRQSIGRFKNLPQKEQAEIVATLNILRVNPDYADKHGLPLSEARSMAKALDYFVPVLDNEDNHQILKRLRVEKNRYRLRCLRERRLFYEKETPIVLIGN